ncbi:MAG TPA: vitamin B12-dependent ribonucleotide reductase, partial [Polyangia bacterium]|nr:vitamin B12-dependent ribonucleotide reductase [Polyangia bacterium]
MLDKHDVKRSRSTRANGNGSATTPTASKPATISSTKSTAAKPAVAPYGLKLTRYFTAPGDDGFANVEWELRTAAISGENGKMVFEQKDVEVPKSWTQTATNVVVQKYFRGTLG